MSIIILAVKYYGFIKVVITGVLVRVRAEETINQNWPFFRLFDAENLMNHSDYSVSLDATGFYSWFPIVLALTVGFNNLCRAGPANIHDFNTTAIYYGKNPPIDALSSYRRVIVEPENIRPWELEQLKKRDIRVYAYLSIGEVGPDRAWHGQIDPSWVLGINRDWNTTVLDLTSKGWRNFLIEQRVGPLWLSGYRGFFLDTMDSYRLYAHASEVSAQQQGIIELITAIHEKFSTVRLLYNRGFDVLDAVARFSDGIVAESLFAGWDPRSARYKVVDPRDRAWLIEKLTYARHKYNLPVTVIDYLPLSNKIEAKRIARKITDLGFTPWVSNVELDKIGVGLQ